MEVQVVWGKKQFSVGVSDTTTLHDLKQFIFGETNVLPQHQKIMGLKGKASEDAKVIDVVRMSATGKGKISVLGQEQGVAAVLAAEAGRYEEQRRREEEQEKLRYEAQMRRQMAEEAERERIRAERAREEQRLREERQRAFEEARQREQEEAERRRMEGVSMKLKCFSVAFAPPERPLSNFGDRASLPAAALQMLMEAGIELPVNLRLTNDRLGTITYCSAGEFNAPENHCYVPHWQMVALQAEEGEDITIQTVQLPKGTGVTLRPHSSSWRSLNQSDSGEAFLSEQFSRNYSSLTAGQTIELKANRNVQKFDVVEVRPDDMGAISLLLTDLQLVLLPPLEQEEDFLELKLDEDVVGHVSQGKYLYFSVFVKAQEAVVLKARANDNKGDPDIYVSTTSKHPSMNDFETCNVDQGPKELTLTSSTDATFIVAVSSWNGDCSFTMRASLLESSTSAMSSASSNNSNNDIPSEFCSNCRRMIPVTSLQLHMVRCKQLVWHCDDCDMTMSMGGRDKHVAILHEIITCECGSQMPRRYVGKHKRVECVLRAAKCRYCGVYLIEQQRGEHQGLCGHKRASCKHCPFVGKRNEMSQHCEKSHNVWQPKANVDWFSEF